ncbi:hypothetical protein [Stenotrophomonas maltophilia]|uniref:hypothetical protein n=1 Tax=Stenotrophomonas maltophilia TaxID=40324 RepID=UPI00115D6ABF|nr:hypothetical protein [Stenotrophomonas maltophilia]
MSVFIDGRSIPHPGQLGSRTRRVLPFIDGGQYWLQWAIDSHEHRYGFSDEGMMLDGVQQGLHGSRMTWLPNAGVQVSPVKLLSLNNDELDALRQLEAGQPSNLLSHEVQGVLARHSLLSNQALGAYRAFLVAVGAGDAPLLQQLDFRESLALCQLASEQGGQGHASEMQAEAARFALLHARRPIEFADYFRFYQRSHPTGSSSELRLERATHALQTLLPMLFGYLDGPLLPHLPSPDQVRAAMAETLAANRQIGYARISLAAQQVAQFMSDGSGVPLDGERLREAARRQLRSAQEFLDSHPVSHGRLGQDGASVQFAIDGSKEQAVIQVEDNVISLLDYRRIRRFAEDEAEIGYQADAV